MSISIVWKDYKGREYTVEELETTHLVNIIAAIPRGIGHIDFVTPENIQKLLAEVSRREVVLGLSKNLEAASIKLSGEYVNARLAKLKEKELSLAHAVEEYLRRRARQRDNLEREILNEPDF